MILVTGGTGNIGRRLVRRLSQQAPVKVLIWGQEPDPFAHEKDVITVRGDVARVEDLEHAFRDVTEVFHLAAAMGGAEEDFISATLRGTENVVRLSLSHEVKKFMYLSSLSVLHLSKMSKKVVADEKWDYEPNADSRGYYTKYKFLAERVVLNAVKEKALPACILRPAEVLFPQDPLLSIAGGKEIGPLILSFWERDSNIPLIEVDDLVDVMVRLWEQCGFEGEIFNIVDPHRVTQTDYLDAYRRHHSRKIVVKLPFSFVLRAAKSMEALLRPIGFQIPVTEYRLRTAIGPRLFSCQAVSRLLGAWEYTGVRDYLDQH